MNGDGLRQLTDGPWNDFDPCVLPNGRIAFISERRGGYLRCGIRPDPTYTLHGMMADGSDVRRLTNNNSDDSYPSWSPIGETLSHDPWFGPPWCYRDTDGDFNPDTPSTTFTTADVFSFIVFPFRNMEDGVPWMHVWNGATFVGGWDSGESGFHVAMFSAPSLGAGPVTIQLFLEGEMVQEIHCEVVEQ